MIYVVNFVSVRITKDCLLSPLIASSTGWCCAGTLGISRFLSLSIVRDPHVRQLSLSRYLHPHLQNGSLFKREDADEPNLVSWRIRTCHEAFQLLKC